MLLNSTWTSFIIHQNDQNRNSFSRTLWKKYLFIQYPVPMLRRNLHRYRTRDPFTGSTQHFHTLYDSTCHGDDSFSGSAAPEKRNFHCLCRFGPPLRQFNRTSGSILFESCRTVFENFTTWPLYLQRAYPLSTSKRAVRIASE